MAKPSIASITRAVLIFKGDSLHEAKNMGIVKRVQWFVKDVFVDVNPPSEHYFKSLKVIEYDPTRCTKQNLTWGVK